MIQAWLYQMSTLENWHPRDYRVDVWEGRNIGWRVGRISPRGFGGPRPGDTIVLFFAKTGNQYPGIYGYGIIQNYFKHRKKIEFQVTPPSDYLKMDPIWDKDVEKLIDSIRGKIKQGTLWGISPDEFPNLLNKIRKHVGIDMI